MPSCAGMHNARWKQGKSLAERREFRRFFQGKVLDKKQLEITRYVLSTVYFATAINKLLIYN